MTKRTIKEIRAEEQWLSDFVWYERKLVMLANIHDGTEEMPHEDIMDGMTTAMRKVEARLAKENLGVHDDFEWGMINGKLSALRWILGDDWDMLDT
jgi:hypothetical protein